MSRRIRVINIKEGDRFQYPLILIRGQITATGENTTTHITVLVNNGSTSTCDHPVIKGQFRALCTLPYAGPHRITVRDRDDITAERILHVNYDNENDATRRVLPLYIVCDDHDDGRFQAGPDTAADNSVASAQARIGTGVQLLQTVIAEILLTTTASRKQFHLQRNTDGTVKVHVFHSMLCIKSVTEMTGQQLWEYFAREIMRSPTIADVHTKYVAFLACSTYNGHLYRPEMTSFDDWKRITDGYVALGGGGLALFGTAALHSWPVCTGEIFEAFRNDTVIDRSKVLDDSAYGGTVGTCFSTTLGSVLHELCHCFDIGHNTVGIMGHNYHLIRNLFLPEASICTVTKSESPVIVTKLARTMTNAVHDKAAGVENVCLSESAVGILNYHPWFNRSDLNIAKPNHLAYDASSQFIRASAGIRIIELRCIKTELVLRHWIFPGKILKYSFMVDFSSVRKFNDVILFAIDSAGNIIKNVLNLQKV